ncbi:MAG: NAD(P)/FAD-dependent oxidoreductase [Oscillospiraceae bacterium]|nr:NAD(P)/FAD-dependent oxidoreductase [Oscillospiraceae bacterium]
MTVLVIGAGAAGLIAAGTAAKKTDKVVLVEKNDVIGKKLRITGKGRCNITNSADIEDLIASYPGNAKFLYSALYTFTNYDIIDLIEENGVKTKVERGGRVFPVSDRAQDVVKALGKYALKENVSLKHANVKSLMIKDGRVSGVKTDRGDIYADAVIVCTGGKSYPGTGSTGDGYKFAAQAGHTIIEPKASLIPVITEEKWVKDIMGLSLRNIRITAYNEKNKKVYSDFGEMLFTHFGISGPVVLSMSAYLRNIGKEKYRIEIDLKSALDDEQLTARVIRDFEKYNKKHLINGLDDLLPKALIPVIIKLSGIDAHKAVNEITREERSTIVKLLKHFPLTAVGVRPVEEAIVTSGGVKVSEINPSTMESKLVKGLYFAGEVIDVDGYTGGFNLQAAFSTGYLAGDSAADSVSSYM